MNRILGIVFFESSLNLLKNPINSNILSDIVYNASRKEFEGNIRVLYEKNAKPILNFALGTGGLTANYKVLNETTSSFFKSITDKYVLGTCFGLYFVKDSSWNVCEKAYLDYVFNNEESILIKKPDEKLFLKAWMHERIEQIKMDKKKEELERLLATKVPVRDGKFEDYLEEIHNKYEKTDFEQVIVEEEPEIFEEIEESKPVTISCYGTNYDSFVQKLSTKKSIEKNY